MAGVMPAKTAHQGVSTGAPPRATRSHFTYLPTWAMILMGLEQVKFLHVAYF